MDKKINERLEKAGKKKKPITITLEDSLIEELKEVLKKVGMTISPVINEFLWYALNAWKKEQGAKDK